MYSTDIHICMGEVIKLILIINIIIVQWLRVFTLSYIASQQTLYQTSMLSKDFSKAFDYTDDKIILGKV